MHGGFADMIDVADLKKAFSEKLIKSGSMDEALTKALWLAYKKGISDGVEGKPAEIGH